MYVRNWLLRLFGLLLVFTLTGCQEDVFETDDSLWLAQTQQGDFTFRMTTHVESYDSIPCTVFEPGEPIEVVSLLGYSGDEKVNIAYSTRLISVAVAQGPNDPKLIAPPFDPDKPIEQVIQKGEWTGGTLDNPPVLTLPPGDFVIHGLVAFQVDGKQHEMRTQFKVHVKKA